MRRISVLASFLAVLTGALAAATLVLYLIEPGAVGHHTQASDSTTWGTAGISGFLIFLLPFLAFPVVGLLIALRRPENRIAWLLLASGLFWQVGIFGSAWADFSAAHPAVPAAAVGGWLGSWTWIPALGLLGTFTILWFPDGHLPSKRWRIVSYSSAISIVAVSASSAITPGTVSDVADLSNPVALHSHLALLNLFHNAILLLIVSMIASMVSLFVRNRHADAEQRQQLRWLLFAAAALVLLYAVGNTLVHVIAPVSQGEVTPLWVQIYQDVTTVSYALIPVAIGIAVLKYRLYDIDVVIRKTLVFGLLAAFITGVYALIVGVVSARFERAGSFIAAATLAVLFAPARDRARKIADRLVYGKRATPYEVLAEFSERVGETYADEDVLSRMVSVLMEGTGAMGARVLLQVGTDQRESAAVGERGAEETVVAVTHRGEELGALAVSMPAADPMNPAKRQLVEGLAAQAGLVLRNVKLIEELKASRQRLVAAQDEERRKLERNIHDGAQQQLVALAVQLKLAGQFVGKDPKQERELLERLGAQTHEALEDLRDLARGIYPPLLADKGLPAALEAQARKAVVPTTVKADGIGRFPQDVESAVYFSCLEALQNVAKYAEASSTEIALSDDSGELRFSVTDDGRGFDPASTAYGTGLQGIADRLAAISGEIRITSGPGHGTTIAGRVRII